MPSTARSRRTVRAAQARYAATDPLLVWSGSYTDSTASGRSVRTGVNLDFAFRGSAAYVQFFGQSSGTVHVSVDRGAYCTVSTGKTSTPSGFVKVTPDLPDGAHEVRIRQFTISYGVRDNLQPSGLVKIIGSAPALVPHRFWGGSYTQGAFAAATWTGFSVDGSSTYGANNGGQASYAGTTGSSCVRVLATTSQLSVWCYQWATTFRLFVDGVAATGAAAGAQSGDGNAWYDWITFPGLDGAAEHEYQIFGSGQGFFGQLMAGWGGSFNLAGITAQKSIVFVGDSITAGTNGVTAPVNGYATLVSGAKRKGIYIDATAGSSVHADGATKATTCTGQSANADRVVILYGTNDLPNIPGTYSLATFQSDYQSMLSTIVAGMAAGTKIYCLGVLNRTGYDGTQRDNLNGAISAAVTAAGNADTSYVSTDGWITAATDTSDGLHPTDAGAVKVATQLAAIVA